MRDADRPVEELLDQIATVRAALQGVAREGVHSTAEAPLRNAPAATDHVDSVGAVLALIDHLLRYR